MNKIAKLLITHCDSYLLEYNRQCRPPCTILNNDRCLYLTKFYGHAVQVNIKVLTCFTRSVLPFLTLVAL